MRPRPMALLTGAGAAVLLACASVSSRSFAEGGATAPRAEPSPRAAPPAPPPVVRVASGTLVVCEDVPWLVALAAPAVAQVASDSPWLLVQGPADPPLAEEVDRLAPRAVVQLACEGDFPVLRAPAGSSSRRLVLGLDGPRASLQLARALWGRSERALLAPCDDPAAILQAASLGAIQRAPVLLYRRGGEAALGRGCAELGVREAWAVGRRPLRVADLAVRDLTPIQAAAEARLLLRRGGPIHALALARPPAPGHSFAGPSWLGPYYTLTRRAPLLLLEQQDPAPIPADVAATRLRPFADACGRDLRSLLVLGDEAAIAMERRALLEQGAEEYLDYLVGVEPGSTPRGPRLAPALGVGRIPWELGYASRALLRSVARARLLEGLPARALIAANPDPRDAPLPLCETVARFSAAELQNHRVEVEGFYGVPLHAAAPRAALARAQLAVYQGHAGDDTLFFEPEEDYEEEGDEDHEDHEDRGDHEGPTPGYQPMDPPEADPGEEPGEPEPRDEPQQEGSEPIADEPQASPDDEDPSEAEEPSPAPDAEPGEGIYPERWPLPRGREANLRQPEPVEPAAPPVGLDAAPLVILQSCTSLPQGQHLVEVGAAGVVGSTTKIHSASGSAFAHALIQSLLWRGATIGEALRDARALFLLVDDLKAARGHERRQEAQRVTWSFLLLGDPELRPLALSGRRPKRAGLKARWREGRLEVRAPKRRLRSEVDQLVLRAYPGSYTAGMVRRSKESQRRFVAPLHLLRVERPSGALSRLRRPGAKRAGTVLRESACGRYVYVLHLGSRLKPKARYRLEAVR